MHRGYKSDDNDNFKSGILRELSLGNFEPDFLNELKFLVFHQTTLMIFWAFIPAHQQSGIYNYQLYQDGGWQT